MLGNGDGTFRPPVGYDSGGGFPDSLQVADVNGDHIPDVIVANCGTPSTNVFCPNGEGTVAVLPGKGDGNTFHPAVTYPSGGIGTGSLAIGDVNRDGIPDLVVANTCADPCTGGGAAVLLGNGDGSFQPAVGIGLAVGALALGDVNGDGKLDLVVLALSFGTVDVLLGNGDGTFQPPTTSLDPGLFYRGVAVGDLNGDDKLDLVVVGGDAHSPNGQVVVFLGNGDGSFRSPLAHSTGGTNAFSVTIADVSGDGYPDLIVGNCASHVNNGCVSANGVVGVLTGTGHGTFRGVTYGSGAPGTRGVAVGDVNGDGKPDLVAANYFTAKVSVLLNDTAPFGYRTSNSLASSLNPSLYGQSITWTSTVTTIGPEQPTGSVKFSLDGKSIGTVALNASGVATLTKSNVGVGAHSLIATYGGDSANAASTSAILNQVVSQTTSSAAIVSSLNPSTPAQPVTFTATFTSPTVTVKGPVTFTAGTTVLGTVQLNYGKAKLTTSSLPVGSTKIKVAYLGDSDIAAASASVTQKVQN